MPRRKSKFGTFETNCPPGWKYHFDGNCFIPCKPDKKCIEDRIKSIEEARKIYEARKKYLFKNYKKILEGKTIPKNLNEVCPDKYVINRKGCHDTVFNQDLTLEEAWYDYLDRIEQRRTQQELLEWYVKYEEEQRMIMKQHIKHMKDAATHQPLFDAMRSSPYLSWSP